MGTTVIQEFKHWHDLFACWCYFFSETRGWDVRIPRGAQKIAIGHVPSGEVEIKDRKDIKED